MVRQAFFQDVPDTLWYRQTEPFWKSTGSLHPTIPTTLPTRAAKPRKRSMRASGYVTSPIPKSRDRSAGYGHMGSEAA